MQTEFVAVAAPVCTELSKSCSRATLAAVQFPAKRLQITPLQFSPAAADENGARPWNCSVMLPAAEPPVPR